jgi:hypothetical protein
MKNENLKELLTSNNLLKWAENIVNNNSDADKNITEAMNDFAERIYNSGAVSDLSLRIFIGKFLEDTVENRIKYFKDDDIIKDKPLIEREIKYDAELNLIELESTKHEAIARLIIRTWLEFVNLLEPCTRIIDKQGYIRVYSSIDTKKDMMNFKITGLTVKVIN